MTSPSDTCPFDPATTPYELTDLSVPVLANTSLRIAASVVYNSYMVRNKLLADSNGFVLRARPVPDAPALYPFLPEYATKQFPNAQTLPLESLAVRQPDNVRGFRFETIADFHDAYKSLKVSPVQVAAAVSNAIQASNDAQPPLRAIINSVPDRVLQQARASEQRYKEGKPLTVLDGVPVAVKDELDVADYPTFVGTAFLGRAPAKEDSSSVARLRAAGAIIIGKANMHEIGLGTTGANIHHGCCRNPYNVGHHTGGSSSGSASAVGAGLCPLSIGCDGGGSIRIPAALCGVVGLKPTWSRISEHGAFALCPSLGHTGPIASTVRDCAIGYLLMAGEDAKDPFSLIQPQRHLTNFYSDDLSNITIGIYDRFFDHADPQIVATCRQAVDFYVSKGAKVKSIAIPELEEMKVAHLSTIIPEMWTQMRGNMSDKEFGLLGPTTRVPLCIGQMFSSEDYVMAQRYRARAIRNLRVLFEEFGIDVIALPATAIVAPPINEGALSTDEMNAQVTGRIMRFSILGNLTGVPGITFPAGYTPEGLPISLQLMGKWYDEHLLLQMARVAESAVERLAPKVHYPVLKRAMDAETSGSQ